MNLIHPCYSFLNLPYGSICGLGTMCHVQMNIFPQQFSNFVFLSVGYQARSEIAGFQIFCLADDQTIAGGEPSPRKRESESEHESQNTEAGTNSSSYCNFRLFVSREESMVPHEGPPACY